MLAVTMADRADWERVTRQQRLLAVAADAELRRRQPDLSRWSPLGRNREEARSFSRQGPRSSRRGRYWNASPT